MNKQIDPNRVYDVNEIAQLLGVNKQTVLEYCRVGMLPAVKIKEWKILGKSLLDFLQKSYSRRHEGEYKSFKYVFNTVFNGTDWGLSSSLMIINFGDKSKVTTTMFGQGIGIINNRFATQDEAVQLGKRIAESIIDKKS